MDNLILTTILQGLSSERTPITRIYCTSLSNLNVLCCYPDGSDSKLEKKLYIHQIIFTAFFIGQNLMKPHQCAMPIFEIHDAQICPISVSVQIAQTIEMHEKRQFSKVIL